MEMLLSIVALLVAVVAFIFAFNQRAELERTRQAAAAASGEASQARQRAEEAERSIATLRDELEQVRGELATLRSLAEAPPPLTLPRGRSGGLDDLREQLRAAAEEEAAESDET